MYAVVNHFHFNIPVDKIKEHFLKKGLDIISSFPGFYKFYFIKEDEEQATVIIIWEDENSAQNTSDSLRATWFSQYIRPYLIGNRNTRAGEVVIDYPLNPDDI